MQRETLKTSVERRGGGICFKELPEKKWAQLHFGGKAAKNELVW